MPTALRYRSYAKINTYLDVLPKRPDGFHDLETLFVSVSLFDELRFESRESGIAFTCNADNLGPDDANLVVRAARLLQESAGCSKGVSIALEKRIPVAAGLAGGSGDAAATLAAIEPLGFNVTQVYGLTETYGPATECTWHDGFDALPPDERAAVKARTGVLMPFMEEITVTASDLSPTPRDAASLGEIMHRGNGVMKGYYKNPEATRAAFQGGYFHSGDIAYRHADGYIKIADRAKDIIISGGENVSSVEVEGILMQHPAVMLAAVVAKSDDKWGEVPCAFVELKEGADVTPDDLIAFCRSKLAGFKTPKAVVFCELPKTSTGKIQKFELREQARAL